MKELFIQNSTLSGSLMGNRFVYDEVAKKTPDIKVEAVTNTAPQPETPEQAIAQERTFMDKVKLKMGLTTEARLPLEKQMDGSKNQQETLNQIAADLLEKANAEGPQVSKDGQKSKTSVDFSRKYGVNVYTANNVADITSGVLLELTNDRKMVTVAMDFAKKKVYEQPAKQPELVAKASKKETEQPAKQPELVAQAPKKVPIKQPKLTPIASVSPKVAIDEGGRRGDDIGQVATLPKDAFTSSMPTPDVQIAEREPVIPVNRGGPRATPNPTQVATKESGRK